MGLSPVRLFLIYRLRAIRTVEKDNEELQDPPLGCAVALVVTKADFLWAGFIQGMPAMRIDASNPLYMGFC